MEVLFCCITNFPQTNILSAKTGHIKAVFYGVKDNVPASSMVVEFEEEKGEGEERKVASP